MNRQKAIRAFDVFSAGLSYFKNGYGGYLTFIVSLGGSISSFYYLTVRQTPQLFALFPTLTAFLIPAVFAIPLAIFLGWFEQNSSLRRGQVRIDPFQRNMFEVLRRIAEKEGWNDVEKEIQFLLRGTKK